MCNRILSFIANLYPFNSKITRSTFLKFNLLITIIIGILFFNNSIPIEMKINFIPIFLLLLSPIGIYQYLSKENPLKMNKFTSSIACLAELLLFIFSCNIFLKLL